MTPLDKGHVGQMFGYGRDSAKADLQSAFEAACDVCALVVWSPPQPRSDLQTLLHLISQGTRQALRTAGQRTMQLENRVTALEQQLSCIVGNAKSFLRHNAAVSAPASAPAIVEVPMYVVSSESYAVPARELLTKLNEMLTLQHLRLAEGSSSKDDPRAVVVSVTADVSGGTQVRDNDYRLPFEQVIAGQVQGKAASSVSKEEDVLL